MKKAPKPFSVTDRDGNPLHAVSMRTICETPEGIAVTTTERMDKFVETLNNDLGELCDLIGRPRSEAVAYFAPAPNEKPKSA